MANFQPITLSIVDVVSGSHSLVRFVPYIRREGFATYREETPLAGPQSRRFLDVSRKESANGIIRIKTTIRTPVPSTNDGNPANRLYEDPVLHFETYSVERVFAKDNDQALGLEAASGVSVATNYGNIMNTAQPFVNLITGEGMY
jgi:hypothetical protein